MHDGLTPSNSMDNDLISKQIKELEEEKLILENLSNDKNHVISADEMITLKEKSAQIARLKKSTSMVTDEMIDLKEKSISKNKETSITQIIEDEVKITSNNDKKLDVKEVEVHISLLKQVKIDHSKWVSYIHLLTEHGKLSKVKDNIQENYTLCKFGKWYYNEGQTLLFFDEFKNLEPIHKKLHKSYSNMYKIFSEKNNFKGFSFFKNQTKIKFEKAHNELTKIDTYSKEIIHNINLLIEILHNLNNEEFQSISKQG